MRHALHSLVAALCATLLLNAAEAAEPIKIAAIVELSGAGATSGTNFRNGVELAIKEINAAGGILGRPIDRATPTSSAPASRRTPPCPRWRATSPATSRRKPSQ